MDSDIGAYRSDFGVIFLNVIWVGLMSNRIFTVFGSFFGVIRFGFRFGQLMNPI